MLDPFLAFHEEVLIYNKTLTADTWQAYSTELPSEILELWQVNGFGGYANGLLTLIDPTDYENTLREWLGGQQPRKIPIVRTAFGNLFYYRADGGIHYLDVHYKKVQFVSADVAEFFNRFLCSDNILQDWLWQELYQTAVATLGHLDYDEIFAFRPPLALGGQPTMEYIDSVLAQEHLHFLWQLE